MRTNDVHEHIAERLLDAISMAVAVSGNLRLAVVWHVTRDYIQNFFFTRPRQI